MEDIVLQLLNNDVAVRGRGFVKLTEAYKKPNSMSDLFTILHSSSNSKVREYAAVLLKKRLVNAKHWFRISQVARTDYKTAILKQLINGEVSLRSSILELTSVITNHELTNSSSLDWPELLESIEQLLNGESSSDKEAGISLLSIIAANRPESLMQYDDLIVCFLTKTLQSLQELNDTIIYNILLIILHLAPIVKDKEKMKNAFDEKMPQVICSIQALTEFDKNQANDVLDLLDGLCKNVPEVISLHASILITTCICVAENKLLDDSLRIKGLKIIKWLSDTKNLTIRKNELVVPIINTIYSVMSEPVHNELGDFYLNAFTNKETPITCAIQILDVLSQHLPPQDLIPEVLQRMELPFEESDIYTKRGRYLAMATVVDHCSKFIENECSETFFKYVQQSFSDSEPVVRNAVQFTLARFVKYLQMKPSEELFTVLWEYLDSSWTEIEQDNDVATIHTLFHMLDVFSEFFEDLMARPYLPRLMDYLFGILERNTSNHVKILALKSFCNVTNGIHEEMSFYVSKLITILRSWISEMQNEETAALKAEIFVTLSSIGRRIDEEEIPQLAEYFLKIGVQIAKNTINPILKKAVYHYLAETSHTVPTLVANAFSQVFDDMIRSVQIAERSKSNRFEDVENEDVLLYQESENNTFDDDEIEDNATLQSDTERSNIEEKREAIVALGVLSLSLRESFYPYLERSYREVLKTINYPETIICQASLYTLSQFFEAFSRVQSFESKEMMRSSVDILIPILLGIIYKTNETCLSETAVIIYSRILEFMKSKIPIEEGYKNSTVKCIIDILSGNTICQNLKETNTDKDNHLKYSVRSLLVNLQGLISTEEFSDIFELVLPSLLRYAEEGTLITRERSFGVRMISQFFQSLGHSVSKFTPELVPLLVKLIADPDTELRSEASTAIARIVRDGGDALFPFYPDILQTLLAGLQTEINEATRDHLISTIGTLIWRNYSILPIEEVFPIFVNNLPLKTSVEEYEAVFGGILSLGRDRHPVLHDYIQGLMKIAVNLLKTDVSEDQKVIGEYATEFLEIVRQDYADMWESMENFLSSEEVIFIEKLNLAEPSDMGILV